MPQIPEPRYCRTWAAEAAYLLLQNNLHAEVAENPAELIVYGGTGKAARNQAAYEAILHWLQKLGPDETLMVQSGKPVGILPTHEGAPRVLIANSNLVPQWATWEYFNELDRKGLMMYGQMTAGSWIYIGTQGILQGTYQTFMACGHKYFGTGKHPLKGRIVVSAGLGGMGGAQPLAAKLTGAAFLGIEVDATRLKRRLQQGYLDEQAPSIAEGIKLIKAYATQGIARSVGVVGHAVSVLQELFAQGVIPDVLTDQTSAHDPLNGYVPSSLTVEEAEAMRREHPAHYTGLAKQEIGRHVRLMLALADRGAKVFDYGNNIRGVAKEAGVAEAFFIPGFVPEFIRPLFCEGYGPFRWVALSGNTDDILATDWALLDLFPDNPVLTNWLCDGAPHVPFQGLPARICWLKYGEREKAGVLFNKLVAEGKVSGPLAIGRDHLDCGSVASPYRETEAMLDGSDAVSDWPILNALINAVNGASWVSFHHGGGVGMGLSQHAGMVIVADGTEAAERRLRGVLNSDPATGVIRHSDAGYTSAQEFAKAHGIKTPLV